MKRAFGTGHRDGPVFACSGCSEFAQPGWGTYSVSAGRTHGSAPTVRGEDGQKLLDVFCDFNAHVRRKFGVFYGNTEESVHAPCCDIIVGADLCVRPW